MEEVIRPFYHNHPLILKENVVSKEERVDCYGCGNPIAHLEMSYVCMDLHCSSRNRIVVLHKKCGELPSEIRHPKHPDHPIHLFDFRQLKGHLCDVCRRRLKNVLGYRCSRCKFDLDITCEKVGIDALIEDGKVLRHPSHLDHPLTLIRKPPFPFYCDGCGDEGVDMAYICSTCEFMIHKTCATSLPLVRECGHHHHPLSLAFSFPKEHSKYCRKCDVCDKLIDRTCWVYFCGDCRYFVHTKCTTKPDSNSNEDDDEDGFGVIKFPLYANDISDKLIRPFVMREEGLNSIPIPDTTASNSSFTFKYHHHPLSLVCEGEAVADDDDGDDEEEELKICDACVTPISNSTPYYHCAATACTYFLHSICSLLPTTLQYSSSDHPNLVQLYGDCQEIPNKNHNFTLYKSEGSWGGIFYWFCELCNFATNGMGYRCGDCGMTIDVKCASLPTTIRHSSHLRRHHKSLVLTRIPSQEEGRCHGCYYSILDNIAYRCTDGDCDFALDLTCALLPMSIIREREEWDSKHPLLLTFDASLDHPSDFFCDFCETEMHPKRWMYHCRQCDLSFHLFCLRSASGSFRNMKFGRRYEMNGIHPANHPLTFNYITLKRSCDLCHVPLCTYLGFECVSCYYVVCRRCGYVQS